MIEIEPSQYKRSHVYIKRRNQPKFMFKLVKDKIKNHLADMNTVSHLDVGGATGELSEYLISELPNLRSTCLDYDKTLVNLGKKTVPNCSFVCGDANDMSMMKNSQYDIVTMIGTMSIFDNFSLSLNECIRVARSLVIVIGIFNEFPVDCLIKWKYAASESKEKYNSGLNLFSKSSVENFVKSHSKIYKWKFEKFHLPFDLSKQKDPIRSWTELDRNEHRYLRNGIMPLNFEILDIHISTDSKV